MATEADWLAAFFPKEGMFVEGVECDLAQSMREGTTRLNVVRALLGNPDKRLRGCVAWALWEQGDHIADFLPAIFAGLDDPSDDVRYWCVSALELVPCKYRVEAIVRLFAMLLDSAYFVRAAAVDRIHKMGRTDFEMALATDSRTFLRGVEKAATVSDVQRWLQQGYGTQSVPLANPHAAASLQGFAQLGYGLWLGFRLAESAESLCAGLRELSGDVRYCLAARATELIESGIGAVLPLATDGEARFRRHSWSTLSSVMLEVSRWQGHLRGGAEDNDVVVRQICFEHLHWGKWFEVVPTVIGACRDATDMRRRNAALHALTELASIAGPVAAIDAGTLQLFLEGVDDQELPIETRHRLLSLLQAYAAVFVRDETGINWESILARDLEGYE